MAIVPRDDVNLQAADIQLLSSRDGILGFFTRLEYDTGEPVEHTAETMGLTSEVLKRNIKRIERIAQQDGGVLEVYLADLKSVTQESIQALARDLRDLGTEYFLWVLTSDYDRLDFVLFDPTSRQAEPMPQPLEPMPQPAVRGMGSKGAYLRPRTLTVNRQNPGSVALRVLKRFTNTELDAYYQWDKLKSAYNIADWTEQFFNNRALFSDYYLNSRLPAEPEWREKPEGVMRAFGALFANVRERMSRQLEDVIRRDLFEPALSELGFTTRVGKAGSSDAAEPDYYLYAGTDTEKPLAFCSAYVWDRALDGRDGKDTQTPDENPGAMVVSLLDREDAPDWAIVTNGKTWRLYSRRAHSRATNYYEVDLEEALQSPSPGEAFRYFWLLFRREAFEMPHAGQSFLGRLQEGSAQYAKELEERLKERVFEEIFPRFAEGFIADIRAREGASVQLGPERLNEVFQGTLTFLYRLLFLLYAEARDLLPVKEQRGYYQKSLTRLKTEVAGQAGNIADDVSTKVERAYSARDTELYDRLNELFAAIDAGDPDLNMPLYNGGLFSTQPAADDPSPEAASARFLAGHKIPDRYLAHGLDLLSRDLDTKTHALVFIDYKSLGVRQLGSVYEGLLEFKLKVAQEPMAVVKGKKTEEVIPEREATGKVRERLPKGTVYLENDKRERKASGSYYTPDYIVKYIVAHTVGPVLEEKLDALRQKLREAQRKHSEAIQRKKAFEKQGMVGDDPEKVANTYRHLVDELFDVRVLDPAMGSGHFLVEAVDFITDNMLKFLNAFPWNPVLAELRRTRESILSEMERQGVSVDPARLTDVNLLKRHVLKRCIYGVDLNPMAVELAKVSLWLDSFTLGAPLSFLDHHLKNGNSLIGMRVEEVREAIEQGQMSLFGSSLWAGTLLATDLMRHVGELEDATADQVRQSRAEYGKALDALAPFKRILDVYASRWFGNEVVKGKRGSADTDKALDFLRSPEAEEWLKNPERTGALNDEQRKVATIALQATSDQRFFHWELEFPEVFFGPAAGTAQAIQLKENGGFDAVISNPPYLGGRDWKEEQGRFYGYFVHKYSVSEYQFDIYVLFLEQSVELSKRDGFLGLITPNTWLNNQGTTELRRYILSCTCVSSIVDYTRVDVFESAVVLPIVIILRHKSSFDEIIDVYVPGTTGLVLARRIPQRLWNEDELKVFNLELAEDDVHLRTKLESQGTELGALGDVKFGIKIYETGKGNPPQKASDAVNRIFEAKSKLASAYRPYLAGEDVFRYDIDWQSRWLQYGENLAAPRDPALFEGLRLLVRRIVGQRLICAFTSGDYVTSQLLQVVKPFEQQLTPYLCSLLNSSLIAYYFRRKYNRQDKTFPEIRIYELASLPIRLIPFTTPPERREAMAEKGRKLYERCMADRWHECVLEFVEHHLAQQPEEADVVHDLLAHLGERMIALNKEKQAEQKRFLGWLKGELRVRPDKEGNTGLDSLTGKGKLQNYLGDYQKGQGELSFADLKDVLFKNKGRLGTSLADAMFTHRLEEEYEKSLDMLKPIKERLALTDSLIDQVVYRLYGLTEEEIAIVEDAPPREETPRDA